MRKIVAFLVVFGISASISTALAGECVLTEADINAGKLKTLLYNDIFKKSLDANCSITDSGDLNVMEHVITLNGATATLPDTLTMTAITPKHADYDTKTIHHITIKGDGDKITLKNPPDKVMFSITSEFELVVKFENIIFENSGTKPIIMFYGSNNSPAKKAEDAKVTNPDYYTNIFKNCTFKGTNDATTQPLIKFSDAYRPRIEGSHFIRNPNIVPPLIYIIGAYMADLRNNDFVGNGTTLVKYDKTGTLADSLYSIRPPCEGTSGCNYSNWDNIYIVTDTNAPKQTLIKKITQLPTNDFEVVFNTPPLINVLVIYTGDGSSMVRKKIFCTTDCPTAIDNYMETDGNCTTAPINTQNSAVTCTVPKGAKTKIAVQGFNATETNSKISVKTSKPSPLDDFVVSEPYRCIANDNTYCEADYHCEAGHCIPDPPPVECQADADCPAGEKCGPENKCVQMPVEGCQSDSGCPPGFVCKVPECMPAPDCATNDDCEAGYICNEELCIQCVVNSDCKGGKICENKVCVDPIEQGCTTNADCPSAYTCQNSKCEQKVWCQFDAQCTPGYKCWSNVCTYAGPAVTCTKNQDCPTKQICERNSGTCLSFSIVSCTADSDCGEGFICNTTTLKCAEVPASPSGGKGGGCSLIRRR